MNYFEFRVRGHFECECHRGIRDDFVAQIRLKGPLFGMATDLLSDDTPEEFDSF